jgi:hypothetical protein
MIGYDPINVLIRFRFNLEPIYQIAGYFLAFLKFEKAFDFAPQERRRYLQMLWKKRYDLKAAYKFKVMLGGL